MIEQPENEVKRGRPVKSVAKLAPKITFESVFGDERKMLEDKHDEENPEFKHMWIDKPSLDVTLQRLGGEVVSGVEHGSDVLVRVLRDSWQKKRDIETERSYQMAAKARGTAKEESYSTGNLKQFRKPMRSATN